MDDLSRADTDLQERLVSGDVSALGELFGRHHDRLARMVRFRLDLKLRSRMDPEDLLQEAYLDAARRLGHYSKVPDMSPFVWLRQVVKQTMIDSHRRHLQAQRRDADREVGQGSGGENGFPVGTSVSLAGQLMGRWTSPSQKAIRSETARQLEEAIAGMDPIDQEVLALRHFEELTNGEVAEVLEIQEKAASIRYVRALRRLKEVLSQIPGTFESESSS